MPRREGTERKDLVRGREEDANEGQGVREMREGRAKARAGTGSRVG